MQVVNVRSMGLPNGVPIEQFDSVKEILADVNADESKLVGVVNKYARQKGPLVYARELISECVNASPTGGYQEEEDGVKTGPKYPGFGFARKEKAAPTKENPNATAWDETDQEHMDRFVAAVAGNKHSVAGLTLTGTAAQMSAQVWAMVQSRIVVVHGPWTVKGELAVEGRAKGPRKLAKHLTEAATKVYQQMVDLFTAASKATGKAKEELLARANSWVTRAQKGYETQLVPGHKVTLQGVTFQPFTTPEVGTPEERAAIRARNVYNLASVFASFEEQKRALMPKEEYTV